MTELILKPQNSTDWLYSVNGDFVEYLADGNNFGGYFYGAAHNVTAFAGVSVAQAIDSALLNNPANGNWQGYYQTLVGTSEVPVIAGQNRNDTGLGLVGYSGINLCHLADANGGSNGIYQEAYGLTVGSSYAVNVNYLFNDTIGIGATSELIISVYDNSSGSLVLVEQLTESTLTVSPSSHSATFTATNTDLIVVVSFWSQTEECFTITNVGLTETWETVSYSLSDFTDGSVSLDLFEEAIPLTLSVADFTDAVSNVQSYSKDFRLPSTKRNDRVFSHIYNLDSSIEGDYNAFNPYIKTIATVKEDNIDIFTGELTLNSIDKGSEGVIYNVHLQSIVVGLSSALSNKTLNDLNFNELRHDFTAENVKNSWDDMLLLQNDLDADSLARDRSDLNRTSMVKYPFVNWTGNILDANNNGQLTLDSLEEVYRPWISAKYIFDKIFKGTGFGYDSSFLNSPDFTNLYMDFNHGGENGASPVSTNSGNVQANWDASSTEYISQSYTKIKLSGSSTGAGFDVPLTDDLFDYVNGSIQPLVDNTSLRVVTQVAMYNESNIHRSIDIRLVKESFSGIKTTLAHETIQISGSLLYTPHGTFAVSVDVTLDLGDKVYVEAKTHTGTANLVRQGISGDNDATWIKVLNYGSDAVDFETILSEARGEIGQWDFIKSLMNMFNLLIMPTENPNRFTIEPYSNVFGQLYISDATDDPYFNETTPVDFAGSGSSTNSGIARSIVSGNLKVSADGNQNQNNRGTLTTYLSLLNEERYCLEFDIINITGSGNSVALLVIDSNNNILGRVDTTQTGKNNLNFTFDELAGGSSNVRIKVEMTDGTGNAYDVTFKSIRLVGNQVKTLVKKDWTNKIDEDTFRIMMQDLDKQVDFSFSKDEEDYPSNIYSEATSNPDGSSYNYGDLKYISSDYTALTSETDVSVNSFASTIVKPLNDYAGLTDLVVPCIYQKEDENVFSVYKNLPRLLYNNGIKEFSGAYNSPYQNGQDGFVSEDEYLQFSHFSDFDNITGSSSSSLDYNFTNCPSIVTNSTVKGLFNEFWASYYDEKYHPDTRIYDVSVLLTPNDIFNFNYTDVIRIKSQEFRVNNIQYNPKGMSKINLIKLP
tara:strand:+ start:3280 stop:6585 length:3306 start_codon:yes stop_codon:yes gene_type:complete